MGPIERTVIPVLWGLWLLYWIVTALSVKETRQHESAASRFSHVVPLIVGGVLVGSPGLLGGVLEQRIWPATPAWHLLTIALVAIGLGFSVLARAWLGRNWSARVTLKRDHELIRSGPYAYVRHPIYTGLLVALLGTALAVGNWRALAGFAVLVIAIIRKLTIEERFMADAFGDAYARYRAEVKALVPFVW